MRLLFRGPETGYREAFFEICAEVVHPSDGEEDVDAELWNGVLVVEWNFENGKEEREGGRRGGRDVRVVLYIMACIP